ELEGVTEPAGRADRLELEDVERVRVGPEVHPEEAQEHEHAPEQGVEEELDGRVLAVGASPDPDQEVHRDEHELPEDEEQDEVERDERAGHAGLEQEL